MRRLIAALTAAVAAATVLPVAAHADAAAPMLISVDPVSVVGGGQPIRLTLLGRNLTGVTEVAFVPIIAERSFTVLNDATLVVQIPGSTPAGDYSVRVASPAGSSDPSQAPVFTVRVAAAPPPEAGGIVLPPPQHYTFDPAPSAQPAASAAAAAAPAHRSAPVGTLSSSSTSHNPFQNPLITVVIGVLLGALLYALWGSAGRMPVARRRDLLAQVVARPAQRLRIGRICLHCGKLHWLFTTRRDLWRSGQYCSATCFVAAQEVEMTVQEGEGVAATRLREVVVYSELEHALEAALTRELTTVHTPEAITAAQADLITAPAG